MRTPNFWVEKFRKIARFTQIFTVDFKIDLF